MIINIHVLCKLQTMDKSVRTTHRDLLSGDRNNQFTSNATTTSLNMNHETPATNNCCAD